MKNLVLLLTASFFCCQCVMADSILTSTTFSQAYEAKKIIKATKKSGQLNNRLIRYILKKKKPVDLKLAIINELGWDFRERKKNSEIFLEYIIKHKKYNNYKELCDKADEEILICLAYMQALEDYHNVGSANALARRAVLKSANNSYAINLIYSLINAQIAFNKERFCKVYQICDKVRMNKYLKMDIDESANQIVFDYVDLYKPYCND